MHESHCWWHVIYNSWKRSGFSLTSLFYINCLLQSETHSEQVSVSDSYMKGILESKLNLAANHGEGRISCKCAALCVQSLDGFEINHAWRSLVSFLSLPGLAASNLSFSFLLNVLLQLRYLEGGRRECAPLMITSEDRKYWLEVYIYEVNKCSISTEDDLHFNYISIAIAARESSTHFCLSVDAILSLFLQPFPPSQWDVRGRVVLSPQLMQGFSLENGCSFEQCLGKENHM